MLAEPTRWSHACGNPVVPSPWQMTDRSPARWGRSPARQTTKALAYTEQMRTSRSRVFKRSALNGVNVGTAPFGGPTQIAATPSGSE